MRGLSFSLLFLIFLTFLPVVGYSQQTAGGIPIPTINFNIEEARNPRQVALTLQILFLVTIISLAPAILITLTSYIRIYIVLSFVSRGLATQNIPPAQIVIGLSLFLTFFTMKPIFDKSYNDGIKPYFDGKINIEEGYKRAIKPIREFMLKQTSEKYIYRFLVMSKSERPRTPDDVGTHILIPAFIVNELTISFYMGMIILIPFTVIDIVVASILMSMGMMMLPPVMISFPLKILLFFVVDGWDLLIEKLILSFRM